MAPTILSALGVCYSPLTKASSQLAFSPQILARTLGHKDGNPSHINLDQGGLLVNETGKPKDTGAAVSEDLYNVFLSLSPFM